MKRLKFCILLSAFCFLFTGCARSEITSIVDPRWVHKDFSDIFVCTMFGSLEVQMNVEDAITKELQKYNIEGVPSYRVMPPTRDTSSEDWQTVFSTYDGMIVMELKDLRTIESTVPETTSTTGRIDPFGNISTSTRTSGGHTVSEPRFLFEIKLYDLSTLEVAWFASCQTRGNEFSNTNNIAASIARELVKKLEADGIIKAPIENETT